MMPLKISIAVLAITLVTGTALMAAAARLDPIITGTASRDLLISSDGSNTASEPQQSITARSSSSNPAGSSPGNPRRYTLDVTVAERAPDCVSRKVLLVNGEFQPTLQLTQGDWVEITVNNNIAGDAWPSLFEGISIHWHGFSMKGFAWMDGTKYIAQCPIQRGKAFTYKFQVNEMPGTYFWHDHSNLNRADGLQGPLIVKERAGTPPLFTSDADQTLFLADWWHFSGNAMALRLNRPFDPTKATNSTGSWCWVGLPKSVLINGRGNYHDCEDPYKRVVNQTLPYRPSDKPVIAAAKDLLNPPCVAGQLGPTAEPSACNVTVGSSQCSGLQRHEVVVQPGSTTRLRLINAATLVYMTVCFEKHTVTVIALDAAPVEPKSFYECVDVNTGQRVDVLLKADQAPGSYWLSVGSQYRKGAPSAYGVLRYSTAAAGSTPNPANIVTPAAVADRKWSTEVHSGFHAHQALLQSSTASPESRDAKAAPYLAPAASGQETFKLPEKDVDRRFVLQSTQPIIKVNGMLRWALNNVAHASTPPCEPVLDSVHRNVQWAAANAVDASGANGVNTEAYWGKLGGDTESLYVNKGESKLQVVDAATPNADVFMKLSAPSAGTHVVTVQAGQMIEFVIENARAGFNGGEYASNSSLTSARNGREMHSWHLHSTHFWQVGMGMGAWSPDKVSTYNLEDPPMRDTTTVLFNGTTEDKAAWVAFRFQVNNPGVWPMHCHIDGHMLMGQSITIIADPAGIAKAQAPRDMPECPNKCMLNFANFNPTASEKLTGDMKAPPKGNLP